MPVYPYQKSGKEHYYYAFEVKDKHGNRKTIKKRGFKGVREANAAERAARVEWEKGTHVDPLKENFEVYITTWLANRQDISEHTRITNEGQIKNYIAPKLGHKKLQKITVDDLEDFISYLNNDTELAGGTIKKIFNLVQTCFRSAVKKEHIFKNPFDLLDDGEKPKTDKKQLSYWTAEEVKAFLNSFEDRLKIMFVIAIHTGMRRGEILGLRWKDINLETGQIGIRQTLGFRGMKDGAKTQAGNRSISISPFVLGELKKHKTLIEREKRWNGGEGYEDHDLVVCQPNGRPVSISNFHKFWIRRIEKSGVRPIRFHDLRHTCASLLLTAVDPKTGKTIHPKVVQELLGHSSIKITLDLYSHLMPNMQADAVKALDRILS